MSENLKIKTRYGTFNGFVDERGVKSWVGIPYAQPPVGKLRWQAPQPLQPSDKTFDAKKFGAAAIQIEEDPEWDSTQSEDCLTLNIWARGEKKNLPVMVFIYGGAFIGGYAHEPIYTGTDFVLSHDVIMITLNYRLNVFGFMNFAAVDSNFEDSGYLGTKDQLMALKWIHENIAAFGGNPDNITIFGESAGSVSCVFLSLLADAKGLFNKVIGQSGSVNIYNTPEKTAKLAEMFMDLSGAKTMGDLMKKSSAELKDAYAKLIDRRGVAALMDYLPTCDGKFLPLNPFKALKDGAARGIKILTGNTADEWRAFLLADENFLEMLRNDYANLSPILAINQDAPPPQEIYKAWLKDLPDTEENFVDFANNLDWRIGQELTTEYQSQFEDAYLYLFTEQAPDKNLRSCHALDLPYTFNVPYIEPNPAQNLVKAIQTSWVAFATTGNPDNELIPHWEKYSADNRQTMELNSKGCVLHKDLNTDNLNELRYLFED